MINKMAHVNMYRILTAPLQKKKNANNKVLMHKTNSHQTCIHTTTSVGCLWPRKLTKDVTVKLL